MSNCVIRRLKESINDENLYALDELVIHSDSTLDSDYAGIIIHAEQDIEIIIDDNMYFISNTSNISSSHESSRTKVIPAMTDTAINITGSGNIRIKNKYNLYKLQLLSSTAPLLSFDVKQLIGCNKINQIIITNSKAYGDLGALTNNNLIVLDAGNLDYCYGDITDLLVRNYNTLHTLALYQNLNTVNTISLNIERYNHDKIVNGSPTFRCIYLYGNINNIPSNYKTCNIINYDSGNIKYNHGNGLSGTINTEYISKIQPYYQSLYGLTVSYMSINMDSYNVFNPCNISIFNDNTANCILIKNTPVYGDLGSINNDNIYFISCIKNAIDLDNYFTFSSTTRTTRLALQDVFMENSADIDRLLIAESNLTDNPLTVAERPVNDRSWYHSISILTPNNVSRTSASDAAVAKLTNDGWIVTINSVNY